MSQAAHNFPDTDETGASPMRGSTSRIEAAARTLPRRRFFNDMPDKGLFAAVALFGFACIILVKVNTHIAAEAIMAVAVGVMILYGVVSFRMPTVQMRPDRLGDNFYYLGFIFTLASLSAALIQLRSSPQIEELLGNFGIALVTTVVGVAGRVLFVQMRGELDEIEDRVRRDLAAASAELRAQLDLSLREFETFHTGVVQAAKEAITKSAEETARAVSVAGAAAAQRINEAASGSSAQAEALTQMLLRIRQAVGELPLLGQVQMPNERLEKQLASFCAQLESLIVQLEQAAIEALRLADRPRRRWYFLYLR